MNLNKTWGLSELREHHGGMLGVRQWCCGKGCGGLHSFRPGRLDVRRLGEG